MGNLLTNAIRSFCFAWKREDWFEAEDMPHELRNATVILAEQTIATNLPVPLVAKPDGVYRLANGVILPLETKTHAVATEADVLQLSSYGTVLRNTTDKRIAGSKVAPYGYLRLVSGTRVRYQRVTLFDDDWVVAAWFENQRQRMLAR